MITEEFVRGYVIALSIARENGRISNGAAARTFMDGYALFTSEPVPDLIAGLAKLADESTGFVGFSMILDHDLIPDDLLASIDAGIAALVSEREAEEALLEASCMTEILTPSSPAVAAIRSETGLPLAEVEGIVARVNAGTMTEADTAVFVDAGLIVKEDEHAIISRYCSEEVQAMFASATPEDFSTWFCNLCDLEPGAARDALAAGLVTRKATA